MLPGLLISVLIANYLAVATSTDKAFTYNGFHDANLSLNGAATVEPDGLLRLTNHTKQAIGHAFFPFPFSFINATTGNPLSFSTSFVFAIVPPYPDVSTHGLAFALSPSKELPGALPSQHLGLFNQTDNGKSTDNIVAVELDTVQNLEFDDVDDNHVGIDINSLRSSDSSPAAYFTDSRGGGVKNVSLLSGQPIRLWVEYHGEAMRLDVTLSPIDVARPTTPLLSLKFNLSSFVADEMYAGFSSSTGVAASWHYVLGWSFRLNGAAEELDISKLPSLPQVEPERIKKRLPVLRIALPVASFVLFLMIIGPAIVIGRKMKYSEEREDWEVEYGPHRISYREIYKATKGFRDENILGVGGFGGVYKGVLPKSKIEIAVKRVSNESRQGMKEFVAEIVSIGRVRHRNLVPLLGYSRRQGELLLVYDYMPNGSLDKYLFDRPEVLLSWSQRFRIIKCIAAGLLYLHEEWEKVILHRDIKASNVLVDAEFNGRLGDFGLARLYDHGSNPQTTRLVGTFGYLAPELSRTGKTTTGSDVFAFGAFLLEVACGRRPVELKTSGVELVLVDFVLEFLKRGVVVEARDRRLGEEFDAAEVELVLKLGLFCSHPVAGARPSMRQVMQFLDGNAGVPDMSEDDMLIFDTTARKNSMVDDSITSPFSFAVSSTTFSNGR